MDTYRHLQPPILRDARRKARLGTALFACFGLLLVAVPQPAHAFDWSLKLEPGLAVPVTHPQSDRFNAGGALTLKALFGLGRYIDIGPTVGFLGLPATRAYSGEPGIAWQLGGGLRVKRPHDARGSLGGISPWLDVDALYVRTGPLHRFGFAAAAGLSFAVGEARRFWVGPFIRYFQIVQSQKGNFDNHDAKVLIVGLSMEFGSAQPVPVGAQPEGCPDCPAPVRCPPAADCPPITKLPDRDGDGVPDLYDKCPDVAGPITNQGCPLYTKIIVKEDRLVLKETIQFSWNTAIIESDAHPLLDEVVRALKENKSFNVRIQGHASKDGPYEHNQTLSKQRAEAVLEYLAKNGIARSRLKGAGFSSDRPIESNTTLEGREANRRVIFKVDLIILDRGPLGK